MSDFKSANCLSIFAYVYLLGSLLVSIAVYGIDTFTAVNLLAYDKWAGKINPSQTVSFNVTKYVFSICIILSWANLAYEYMRALRVMNRGAVVESYLDTLAVRLQCIRWTKSGRGWRRFLVFAELTKSKKGAEYVALFSYFALQGKQIPLMTAILPNTALQLGFESSFVKDRDKSSTLSLYLICLETDLFQLVTTT